MDLMEILKGQLNDDLVGQLSQHIGAEPQQTSAAAEGIFATILGGLANNASDEHGLSSLGAALDRDHDGSILDDLAGIVGGMMSGSAQQSGAVNGMGILGHILGDKQETAASQIGQSSGLNMNQVLKLMPILAPIVMSVLGKARQQGGLDLGTLASILTGSAQNAQQGGFGDLLGSVLGSVLGGGQQPSQQPASGAGDLLGSVLGGIFGKR